MARMGKFPWLDSLQKGYRPVQYTLQRASRNSSRGPASCSEAGLNRLRTVPQGSSPSRRSHEPPAEQLSAHGDLDPDDAVSCCGSSAMRVMFLLVQGARDCAPAPEAENEVFWTCPKGRAGGYDERGPLTIVTPELTAVNQQRIIRPKSEKTP